jgi:hypothetical protein
VRLRVVVDAVVEPAVVLGDHLVQRAPKYRGR